MAAGRCTLRLTLFGIALFVGALAAACLPVEARSEQNSATRLSDRILDPAARGNVTYESTANVGSYQRDGLLTYKGRQYVAWYGSSGRVRIARRSLPDGAWHSIELDAVLFADDSHNNVAMGVSPVDGRLHIALPTHASHLRYTRSLPGLADGEIEWASRSFEPIQTALPGAEQAPSSWTYPQFERQGEDLLLTWRDGLAFSGRQVLARYAGSGKARFEYLGSFTDGEGSYVGGAGVSNSRYSYLHGFDVNPVTGAIELTWTWRERPDAACSPGGIANHDLAYARSEDGGRTWLNNEGQLIGHTGGPDLISIEDETTVVPIGVERGMINGETQTHDSAGRLHVVTSQLDDERLLTVGGCVDDFYGQRANATPFHHWRDQAGDWHTAALPYVLGRPGRSKLFFDEWDSAYLVLPDGRIASATAGSQWSDWRLVFEASDVDSISEMIGDRQRLAVDGVLSVAYQETGVPRHSASAFRVADFRLGGEEGTPAAKSDLPESPPIPFGGSAKARPAAVATTAHPGFPAHFAVDGNVASWWSSGRRLESTEGGIQWLEPQFALQAADGVPTPSKPQTLTIEFEKARDIDRIRVTPGPLVGPRDYTIEARLKDGWQAIAEVKGQGEQPLTTHVRQVRTAALRLVITARNGSQIEAVRVAEVAVGSENLAQPKDTAPVTPDPPRSITEGKGRTTALPLLQGLRMIGSKQRTGRALRYRLRLRARATVWVTVQRHESASLDWKRVFTAKRQVRRGLNLLRLDRGRSLRPGTYRLKLIAVGLNGERSELIGRRFSV